MMDEEKRTNFCLIGSLSKGELARFASRTHVRKASPNDALHNSLNFNRFDFNLSGTSTPAQRTTQWPRVKREKKSAESGGQGKKDKARAKGREREELNEQETEETDAEKKTNQALGMKPGSLLATDASTASF